MLNIHDMLLFYNQKDGRVQAQPAQLRALRRVTQNTLDLQALVLIDIAACNLVRVIVIVFRPYMEHHSQENNMCRSHQETRQWLCSQVDGGAFSPLQDTVMILQDRGALKSCGLSLTRLLPGVGKGVLDEKHPAMLEQDVLANSIGKLVMSLLKYASVTAVQYMETYPTRCALLDEPEKAPPILANMARCKDLHDRFISQQTTPFWRRAQIRSIFNENFTLQAHRVKYVMYMPLWWSGSFMIALL